MVVPAEAVLLLPTLSSEANTNRQCPIPRFLRWVTPVLGATQESEAKRNRSVEIGHGGWDE